MKSIITHALFLAAGSVFSQAAPIVFTFGESPLAGTTGITIDGSNVSSVSENLGEEFGADAQFTLETNNRFIIFNSHLENQTLSGVTWSNVAALEAVAAATGLGKTEITSLSSAIKPTIFDAGLIDYTADFSFTGLEANTEYVISTILTPQLSNRTGALTLTAGTIVSGNYGTTNGSGWNEIAAKATEITLPQNNTTALSLVVTSDENGTITFSVSAGSAVSLLSVSLIPEPSAFGLFSGLGALALVAANRRRRSRETA